MDARNNTTAEIGEEVDVSATTVSNRIKKMEDQDIVTGYHPEIRYENVDLPLHILFVCTAPVAKRKDLANRALDVPGVVTVRELISGTANVHVEVVSRDIDEIDDTTNVLDDLGLEIRRSELIKRQHTRPFDHFGSSRVDD